eukprot:gene25702-32189_t
MSSATPNNSSSVPKALSLFDGLLPIDKYSENENVVVASNGLGSSGTMVDLQSDTASPFYTQVVTSVPNVSDPRIAAYMINSDTAEDHLELHSLFAQYGVQLVRTGRLSCSRPNLQNIPNKQSVGGIEINMREMIRAEEGFTFISADYSQIEMRLLAHLCGDPALTALFRQDQDVYRQLAGRILNRPSEKVTAEERNKAKVICLGVLYGMGPTATAAKLNIEVSAAQAITNSFFGCFRGMKAWISSVKSQARKWGYIRTLLGRRRYLPDITSDDAQKSAQAERQAVNSVIQGTASDIIKYAMVHIDKQLSLHWREMCCGQISDIPVPRLVMQIHDELIFTVSTADSLVVNKFVTLLHKAMNTDTMNLLRLSVPLLVNVQQGDSWGQFREYVAPSVETRAVAAAAGGAAEGRQQEDLEEGDW